MEPKDNVEKTDLTIEEMKEKARKIGYDDFKRESEAYEDVVVEYTDKAIQTMPDTDDAQEYI